MLPFELLIHIAEYLLLPCIWAKRRVNPYWKQAFEQAFVRRLQSEKDPLTIHVYLLNSRGSPWFSFSTESIEDYIKIPLIVTTMDHQNKMIRFSPQPIVRKHSLHGVVEQPRLFRRTVLDRMQWCVKMQIQSNDSAERMFTKNKLCTVIAPDTQLNSQGSHGSITTFNMQLVYEALDNTINEAQSTLDFHIISFQCTYSYFFSKLDCDRHPFYGSWSVHTPNKQQLLRQTSKEMGLEWNDKFWSFDIVLHWLTFGDIDMVRSVVDFLVEHELQHAKIPKSPKKRYYKADSINLI